MNKPNPETQADAQARYQALLSRAATDPDFRTRLLTEPNQTLGEFIDQEIPANVKIAFVENEADATIVLPDPVDRSAELSEDELEAVAGGDVFMSIFTSVMGTIAVGTTLKRIGDDDAWFS